MRQTEPEFQQDAFCNQQRGTRTLRICLGRAAGSKQTLKEDSDKLPLLPQMRRLDSERFSFEEESCPRSVGKELSLGLASNADAACVIML